MNNPLLHILHMSDPALPIGGFSHSAGLETYVQEGLVHDGATAGLFIKQQLQRNLFYTDAALVALSFEAAMKNDFNRLVELDDVCSAVKLPKELRQASGKLGLRFLKLFSPLLKHELQQQYLQLISDKKAEGHYCIAFGVTGAALNLGLKETLYAFYYNAVSSFVTNSVKLVPLSQQTGQQLLFELLPLIDSLVEQGMLPDESMIGVCCAGFDIRSMQHERLYTRLYMS